MLCGMYTEKFAGLQEFRQQWAQVHVLWSVSHFSEGLQFSL